MRKDSLAFLLIGFLIGFAALYTWTKQRAPEVVRALPRSPVQAPPNSTSASTTPPGTERPQVDMAQVQRLQQALKDDPKNYEALVAMGNISFTQQNYDDAIVYYRKALDVRPDDVNLRTDLGTTLFYAGLYDDAIAAFRKTLELNPTHTQSMFNLGVALLHGKNDAKGAIDIWERLVETNPNYPQIDVVREQLKILKERQKN